MTNQRHAPTAPSTSFSLLFKVSSRGTVSRFDAFYNFAFRNVLKISISINRLRSCRFVLTWQLQTWASSSRSSPLSPSFLAPMINCDGGTSNAFWKYDNNKIWRLNEGKRRQYLLFNDSNKFHKVTVITNHHPTK